MTDELIDLTNCDRELIHIPSLIQPHGVLLVLQDPTLPCKGTWVENSEF
ncbi:hypothetical protein [Nostoc sp.]